MNKSTFKESIENQSSRLKRYVDKREHLESRLSTIRIGYFLGSLLLLYMLSNVLNDGWFTGVLIMLIAGFLVIMDRHQKTEASKNRFAELLRIKEEHISRMDLDWEQIPYKELVIETKDHPFATDLDLTGKHSVFQLIDTTIFKESAQLLMHWLLEKNPVLSTIKERQAMVKELVPLQAFRDKLRVLGVIVKTDSRNEWTNNEMLKWLRSPPKKGLKKALIILSILALLNGTFLVLMLANVLSPLFLMVSLVSYLIYMKLNDHLIADLFDASFQIEKILNRFKGMLSHVELFRSNKKLHLEKLLSVYQKEDERPSHVIKKAQRLLSRAALQVNQILWLIVNVCIPWDMYHAVKLEQLKQELEPKLTIWLDTFYELEALNALANFAMLHPEYAWPDVNNETEHLFMASQLGHPLIVGDQRVCNDFTIEPSKDLFLITGSNMAGKSTFLRTIGVNLVLTFAGAPVCATSFVTHNFRLFSSINITDSLDDGYSHFYAEVRRLRFLLEELAKQDAEPLFFLVDEIYRGTNNRERYQGSAAFLKEVAGKNGVGLVSSHDLELADLENEIPQLTNLHFVESIRDKKMSFEYILRHGACPSTNALEIMRMEGLPT